MSERLFLALFVLLICFSLKSVRYPTHEEVAVCVCVCMSEWVYMDEVQYSNSV